MAPSHQLLFSSLPLQVWQLPLPLLCPALSQSVVLQAQCFQDSAPHVVLTSLLLVVKSLPFLFSVLFINISYFTQPFDTGLEFGPRLLLNHHNSTVNEYLCVHLGDVLLFFLGRGLTMTSGLCDTSMPQFSWCVPWLGHFILHKPCMTVLNLHVCTHSCYHSICILNCSQYTESETVRFLFVCFYLLLLLFGVMFYLHVLLGFFICFVKQDLIQPRLILNLLYSQE